MAYDLVVGDIEDVLVQVGTEMLIEVGMVPEPQIHLFSSRLPRYYWGEMGVRRYRQGADAIAAITDLGHAARQEMDVERLLIFYEEADLRASVHGPGPHPTGFVSVDATKYGHVVRWRPYDIQVGPIGRLGFPTVYPQWKPQQQIADCELPLPITELLRAWRS